MTKKQADFVKKQFIKAKANADCFMIDDGAILSSCGEGAEEDIFYACWNDEGDEVSCHIPESSFDPENNPVVHEDGRFEVKDNKGYNTIIVFFKVQRITPTGVK